MDSINITLKDEAATAQLAQTLAKHLKIGDVLALKGPLGVGKTALARYLVQSLTSPDTEVSSPSFTLVQDYDTSAGLLRHFDLYRLENPEDVAELGFEEALTDSMVLIEWPQRLGHLCPQDLLVIALGFVAGDETARTAALMPVGQAWEGRLTGL